jgi:hypothetical protein
MSLLCKEFDVHTYAVVFVVHAPLCTADSIEHTYTFKSETIVSKLHIQQVLESARAQTVTKNNDGESSVFREYITQTKLNGYPTDEPIGKSAHDATCLIVQESLAVGVKKLLIDPIASHATSHTIYNFAQLTASLFKKVLPHDVHLYALCEISQEAIQIGIFDLGLFVKAVSMPIGTANAYADIERKRIATHELLHEILVLAQKQSLTKELEGVYRLTVSETARTMQELLTKNSISSALIPQHLFIIAPDATEAFWGRVIHQALSANNIIIDSVTFDPILLHYHAHQSKKMLHAIYAHVLRGSNT